MWWWGFDVVCNFVAEGSNFFESLSPRDLEGVDSSPLREANPRCHSKRRRVALWFPSTNKMYYYLYDRIICSEGGRRPSFFTAARWLVHTGIMGFRRVTCIIPCSIKLFMSRNNNKIIWLARKKRRI